MPEKKKELTQREFSVLGGLARAKAITPERRSEIGRNAINARWDRVRAERAERAEKAKAAKAARKQR